MIKNGSIAVIFTSTRRDGEDSEYEATAARMEELAAEQPGFINVDSVREEHSRRGITVSYWESEEAALAWKAVHEHVIAQEQGRTQWYSDYSVVVAKVERAYVRGGLDW